MFKLAPSLAIVVCTTAAAVAYTSAPAPVQLEASLILEMNDTDQDAEFVLTLDSDEAIEWLGIKNGVGRPVFGFRSNDVANLGINKLSMESAEPDIATVLAAYPEGMYAIIGRTIAGSPITGTVTVSHDLLSPPTLIQPASDAADVSHTAPLTLQWIVDPNANRYLVEFELEDADPPVEIVTTVPGTVGSFVVPAELLEGDADYKWQVKAFNADGNAIATEFAFTTAP